MDYKNKVEGMVENIRNEIKILIEDMRKMWRVWCYGKMIE